MKLSALVALATTTLTLAAPVSPPPPMRTAHHPIGLQEQEATSSKDNIQPSPGRRDWLPDLPEGYESNSWLIQGCLEGTRDLPKWYCDEVLPNADPTGTDHDKNKREWSKEECGPITPAELFLGAWIIKGSKCYKHWHEQLYGSGSTE